LKWEGSRKRKKLEAREDRSLDVLRRDDDGPRCEATAKINNSK
jgi:hypothetical protein